MVIIRWFGSHFDRIEGKLVFNPASDACTGAGCQLWRDPSHCSRSEWVVGSGVGGEASER